MSALILSLCVFVCVYAAVWLLFVLPSRQDLPCAHNDLAERSDTPASLRGRPQARSEDTQSHQGAREADNGPEVKVHFDHVGGVL